MGRRVDALAALLAPPLVVGYLFLGGVLPPTDLHNVWFMVGVLAVLGAGVSAAGRNGLRAAPALAVLWILVLPWAPLFAGGPLHRLQEFFADVLFVAVGFSVAAGVEYAVRNPAVARDVLRPDAVRPAALAGVGLAVVAAAARVHFGLGWAHGVAGLATTAWMLGGTATVGALSAFLAVRYGLFTPAGVVGGLFVGALYDTWRDTVVGGMPTLSSLSVFMLGWFAPAALALLVGYVEHAVREDRPPG